MPSLYPVWTDALHSFMLQDVCGSLAAMLVFASVLYAPGYLLAHASDLFGFRRMAFPERSLWAIATSFCVAPIAAYLAGRLAGLTGVTLLFAAAALVTAVLLARSPLVWHNRDRRITALLACAWTVLVLLLLIDFQTGHKLYFSVVLADGSYRVAFTDAVLRTGIPPANPFYFPAGMPAPMRYFYFWYVLCAAVARLAHVSARGAFIASSAWAGFGLLATVHLYTAHFFNWRPKQRWIALGLLLVTGADLVPVLGQALLQPCLNGDTEWWSVDPIDAWPDSLLWVPHHVAAVLSCLIGFLFLWRASEPHPRTTKAWAVVLAAAAFASAFGLSVYVAFGFALLLAAWILRLAVLRDPERIAWGQRTAIAAALSAILLASFFLELRAGLKHPATPYAGTPHLFTLSIRRMIDSELLTALPAFAAARLAHPVLLDQTVRLLLLPPGLAMELGVYGAVLVFVMLATRRNPRALLQPAHNAAVFFAVCGLVMTMFLSSSVITNNDFGYRAVMLPQFFLLLLTAELLGCWFLAPIAAVVAPSLAKRRAVYTLLTLGAAGTVYWAVLLRVWLPFEVAHPRNGFSQLPADAFEIRAAFNTLKRVAPANAVVAFDPITTPIGKQQVMDPNEFYQRLVVVNAARQMLNAEGKCATHFGGDPAACPGIQDATAQLFASPAPSAEWARAFCTRFGVQFLTLSAWDPNWHATTGWPVDLPGVAQEPRFRILRCR